MLITGEEPIDVDSFLSYFLFDGNPYDGIAVYWRSAGGTVCRIEHVRKFYDAAGTAMVDVRWRLEVLGGYTPSPNGFIWREQDFNHRLCVSTGAGRAGPFIVRRGGEFAPVDKEQGG